MYSIEKIRGLNFIRRFDYMLFLAVLVLSGTGIAVLDSATRVMPGNIDGSRIVMVQLIAVILGIIIAVIISWLDYQDFKNIGFIFYFLSTGLLILVFFIGTGEELGSRSWISLKWISIQPSEFAKITFIIVTAYFLEKICTTENKTGNILWLAAYAAVPVVLVLAQPDMGTALVFIAVFCVMIFVAGLSYKYIGLGILSTIPVFLLGWFFFLEDYQKERIIALFFPESGSTTYSFNVRRSKMAIGSGRMLGQGLYNGTQTQSAGVPVKESDFIFSVLGEELGFIGAVIAIAVILFLLLRCLYIARISRDLFGSFIVAGITGLFAFHYIENIGMCIGILPVTGIPLPFISSGGSAMLTNYIALGIALSVSVRSRRRIIFENTQ